jgi:hypothetical protein
MTTPTLIDSAPHRWRQRLALVLVVGAHLAVVLCWPPRARHAEDGTRVRSATLMLLSAPRVVPRVPDKAERVPRRTAQASARTASASAALPPEAMAPARSAATALPAEPAVAPAPPELAVAPAPRADWSMAVESPAAMRADDILLRAKRDVVAIDRALRKASLNPSDRRLANAQTALAQGIAAANIATSTRIEEFVLPDGRRMSKVIGRLRTYCVQMEPNHTVMGQRRREQGFEMKMVACGNH